MRYVLHLLLNSIPIPVTLYSLDLIYSCASSANYLETGVESSSKRCTGASRGGGAVVVGISCGTWKPTLWYPLSASGSSLYVLFSSAGSGLLTLELLLPSPRLPPPKPAAATAPGDRGDGWLLCCRRRRQTNATAEPSARTAKATPMPTPACAPLDRPPPEELPPVVVAEGLAVDVVVVVVVVLVDVYYFTLSDSCVFYSASLPLLLFRRHVRLCE